MRQFTVDRANSPLFGGAPKPRTGARTGCGRIALLLLFSAPAAFLAEAQSPMTAKIGTFNSGAWSLDANGNGRWDSSAGGDTLASFGQAGDVFVVGDWNGDGHAKIGIFRNGLWVLDSNGNGQYDPGVDLQFYFGQAGDVPVVGDWNHDGRAKVGIFRNGCGRSTP